jgi:hypothetical protein
MNKPSMKIETMRLAHASHDGEEIPAAPGGIALLSDGALEEFSGGVFAEIKQWIQTLFGGGAGGGGINVNVNSPGARAGNNGGPGSGDGRTPPGCTCGPVIPRPPRPPKRDPKLW